MILNKILEFLESLINKIPAHIRDIMAKASLAVFALFCLMAVIYGVQKGLRDAQPEGMQLAKDTRDLFYLQQLREENDRKKVLLEDVEVDPLSFESNRQVEMRPLGRDTMNHLMGEKKSLERPEDMFDRQVSDPGFLGDKSAEPPVMTDKRESSQKDKTPDDLLSPDIMDAPTGRMNREEDPSRKMISPEKNESDKMPEKKTTSPKGRLDFME